MITEGAVGSARSVERVPDAEETAFPQPAQRALTFGLLLSACRCTVQYVLLPFVLPWIGIAASVPPWVTLVLGGLALAALIRNVLSMWRLRHARRWSYLGLASISSTALLIFLAIDLHNLV